MSGSASYAAVKLFGFRALLFSHDTTTFDRWLWLRRLLPRTLNREMLLDAGCGNGGFAIGARRRGYRTLGLTQDERYCSDARAYASICGATDARFEVADLRCLDHRHDLIEKFDVVICLEVIEHVLDDQKLMRDLGSCLKPGGRLLLTTPYYYYRAITRSDEGPFSEIEDGWHVRRGYTPAMLTELCKGAMLTLERVTFCTGLISQKVTGILRILSRMHKLLGWSAILPLRLLPPLFDRPVTHLANWPYFSICIEAYKPRFAFSAGAKWPEVSKISSDFSRST